jgi:hypothetical protein
MEYKGIHYEIVQTANPRGWKWTVFLDDGRTRRGEAATRPHAFVVAERAIDNAMAARAEPSSS